MKHIFISALFVISRVFAINPVTTPAPNTVGPKPTPSTFDNAESPHQVISAKCNAFYFPYSDRIEAVLAAQQTNTPPPSDLSNLSDVKNKAYCQQDHLFTSCLLDSCTNTLPKCNTCVDFISNENGKGNTFGTNVTDTVTCTGYIFNSPSDPPFVCLVGNAQLSCKSCTGEVDCNQCLNLGTNPNL